MSRPWRLIYRQDFDKSPARSNRVVFPLATAGILLLVWHLVVSMSTISQFLLPAPMDVARALTGSSGSIAEAARTTVLEVVLGFALAVAIGLVLAVMITYSSIMKKTVLPLLLIIQSVPKLILAPLLIVWFGFGIASKVMIAFLLAFFPVVIQTSAGLASVDPELHDLARSLHATWFRTFRKIDMPHALPAFFAGAKVAVTLAVTGAVVGEFLSADKGLGFLLQQSVTHFRTDLSFAVVVVIAALSISLFWMVGAIERSFLSWTHDPSGSASGSE